MKIRKIENNKDLPVTKKRNRLKIFLIILACLILIPTVSLFGYVYYKKLEKNFCLDTNTKVYDAYKEAVVLVKHRYGYFAKINGVEVSLDVAGAPQETVYGTGFFIDRDGRMLTNSHVLQPWESSNEENDKTNATIRNLRMKIASILTVDVLEEDYESFIMNNWSVATSYNEDEGEGDYQGEVENEVQQERRVEPAGEEFVSSNDAAVDTAAVVTDIAASIPLKEFVSKDDIEVYVKTIDIFVALHNTDQEWLDCEVSKISEDSNIDLGILQLKDHYTPESVTNIVNLDNAVEDDASLSPGQKAIMIGYPMGMDLAQTNSGIKVQLYDGQISKESDGNKIQYSITSTHGASGAPVFNECGQLIAVNFSGVDQVQGFNFGIVAKHIHSL